MNNIYKNLSIDIGFSSLHITILMYHNFGHHRVSNLFWLFRSIFPIDDRAPRLSAHNDKHRLNRE